MKLLRLNACITRAGSQRHGKPLVCVIEIGRAAQPLVESAVLVFGEYPCQGERCLEVISELLEDWCADLRIIDPESRVRGRRFPLLRQGQPVGIRYCHITHPVRVVARYGSWK